ncbi:MAG: DUF362 domain-containing protein [Endomicrobiia bacterium]
MNKVVVSYSQDYKLEDIKNKILKHIKILNVEEKIKSSKKILLKPNLLAAHSPQEAVTTHPVFVQAVLKLLKELNSNSEIIITDSPSVLNFQEVIIKTEIKKVAQQENATILNINNYPVVEVPFGKFGLEKLVVSRIVKDVDMIINLPKLKTHSLTVFTCAVKNMYGIIPGLTKSLYHKYAVLPQDFLELLYAVWRQVKSHLVIIDGIKGMDKEGPAGGRIRNFNIIVSSTSDKAADWFLVKHILKKEIIPFYKKEYFEEAEVLYLDSESKNLVKKIKVALPQTITFFSFLPKFFVNILKNFIWFRPEIKEDLCKKCGKCYEICPQKTIKIEAKTYYIEYKNCISCFCCKEACPYNAITIEKSFLLKFYSLIKKVFR